MSHNMVIHFKCSIVYVPILNSLTIPFTCHSSTHPSNPQQPLSSFSKVCESVSGFCLYFFDVAVKIFFFNLICFCLCWVSCLSCCGAWALEHMGFSGCDAWARGTLGRLCLATRIDNLLQFIQNDFALQVPLVDARASRSWDWSPGHSLIMSPPSSV